MTRIIAALIIWVALSGAAFAQGCGQGNPNCIVPTAPVGDSSNKAASTKFVQQSGSSGQSVNIEAFGAIAGPGNGAVNALAIQAAINSLTGGGEVLIPKFRYNINNTLNISKPMTIRCLTSDTLATGGAINADSSMPSLDMFHINANNVVIRDCVFFRAGVPTTGKGIVVGTDAVTVSDAICNSTATVTSASNGFATAVGGVGMRVSLPTCAAGPLTFFGTILSVAPGGGSITLTAPVTRTPGGAVSAKFGNVYTDVLLDNVEIQNSNIGIHFINAARFHVRDSFVLSSATGAEGMRAEDQLAPDFGDSFVSNSTFDATADNTNGNAIHYTSGGSLKLVNNKILGGKFGLFVDWTIGLSGGPLMGVNSIEKCGTSAIFVSATVQLNGINISGSGGSTTCGSPNIAIDNASTSFVNGGTITGLTCNGGGGTCFDIGKWSNFNLSANNINNGAVNPAINIRSGAANGTIQSNNIDGATLNISNAGTNILIDDLNGVATASLPSAANGSRMFVTDADPATSPCTHAGAQTGSTAFRQNGAWKCF